MASSRQYNYLRDLYEPAIGWTEANRWVQVLKVRNLTSAEASKEITRLQQLKIKGQDTSPKDYTKDHVPEEDDPKFNAWWKKQ